MSDLLIMEIGCCRKLVSCRNSVILKGMVSCDNSVPWQSPLDVMTGQFDWLYAPDPAFSVRLLQRWLATSPHLLFLCALDFDFSFVLLASLMTLPKNKRCHAAMTLSHRTDDFCLFHARPLT